MATPIESIAKLNDALDGVPFSFAFLGGSVLSLLVTDKAVDAIRVTKDVDVVVDVKNRHEFHAAERLLEARGSSMTHARMRQSAVGYTKM